jgi:hypothetical protein
MPEEITEVISIQKAKDFLWKYLEKGSRDLMIHLANYCNEQENGDIQSIVIRDKIIVGISTATSANLLGDNN